LIIVVDIIGNKNMDKDKINKIQKELNLGATGRYPQGKPFNPSDGGELKSAMVKEGNDIFIIFGKSVEWLALTKAGAKEFGMRLIKLADEE
jgi:hypothetical protein